MFIYIDESRLDERDANRCLNTVAGAAIDENDCDDFNLRLLRLKKKFFKRSAVGEYPLKGRLLLSNRSRDSYRKMEFVREVLSLCRFMNCRVFSQTEYQPLNALKTDTLGGSQTDKFSSEGPLGPGKNACSVRLAYLMERVNSYILEKHPGKMGTLVFKTEAPWDVNHLSASLMSLMYHSPFGSGFQTIIGTPAFMPHAFSPGLQIADLFAYIINQYHGGRSDLRDLFSEIEAMQYISSFEQEGYRQRGMNQLGID